MPIPGRKSTKANKQDRPVKTRKVPQRSCIACRRTQDKRTLIRIVADEDRVSIDTEGKRPGRGAYLCPVYECWELGLKKKRLEYALRTTLKAEDSETLRQFSLGLPRRGESEE